MYVHFTDEEAQALEEKALAHAMAASKADAKAARKGKHGAGHEQPAMIDLPVDPLSHDEAHRLVQHLGADRSMKKTGSFKRMFSRKGSAKSLASQASSRSLQHQASGRSLQSQDSSRSQAAPRDPNFHAQASGGFENGSHADFVLHNGQHNGYANGHALPDSAPYSHQPYVQQQPLAEQPTYYDPQTQSYVTNPFLDPIHGSDTNPFLDPNHGHHVAYGADGYHDPEMAHALAYSAQQAQQAQRGQADAHDDVDEDLLAVAMAENGISYELHAMGSK
ncbi:hypothetical protein WJX72_004686 [[Myrmecia] bisecta]|uniref:Uncharacterized protein n=1 Tax=[Myrmecia] bisecta TaxID=41462 RepID=A0AAW1R760_9CHLO